MNGSYAGLCREARGGSGLCQDRRGGSGLAAWEVSMRQGFIQGGELGFPPNSEGKSQNGGGNAPNPALC